MSTRTPSAQPRSQYGSYWGVFATTLLLPNAAGAPLAAAQFVLEEGDVAFVTGGTLYVCTAPGTAGGADATWLALGGGGLPTIESYQGFAAGAVVGDRDFYLAGSDLLNVPDYTISLLCCIYGMNGTQHFVSASSEFNEGPFIGLVSSDILRAQALDSTGTPSTVDYFDPNEYANGKWVFINAAKDTFGADWVSRLNLNGAQVAFSYQLAGGGARATAPLAIGAAYTGVDHAADLTRIAWVTVHHRTLSNVECQEWWDDLVQNDGAYLAPPGGAPAHRWELTGTPGAVLPDLEGAANLTRTGSAATLTGVTRKFLV